MIVLMVGVGVFVKWCEKKEYGIESVVVIGVGVLVYLFEEIRKEVSWVWMGSWGFEL
ncbi:hypothetical protein [Bacillus pumilus]|uniref:hypothetical protein n=1 Tax=Bacillus pumilus TaxID=1408 RepID=UPI001642E683|nr:hypothetical protein [Bacillus pumilus]